MIFDFELAELERAGIDRVRSHRTSWEDFPNSSVRPPRAKVFKGPDPKPIRKPKGGKKK